MITRAQMQRQLRNRGGIMTVKTIRKKYGIGSDLKDFVRKIIPNEIADVAVKAAPIVAPFNPGAAALMRGIGRFDQRGSLSDALKQGALTYAGGRGIGMLGGAQSPEGFLGRQKFSTQGFKEGPIGSLFKSDPTKVVNKVDKGAITAGVEGEETLGLTGLIKKGIKALPKGVAAQLAAGTITAGASLLASYFQGDFREQEEGETMEDYLVARKEAVGGQMRTYMDNYFKFDSEYSTMTDAQKDAFVARYNVRDGGRIGFANGTENSDDSDNMFFKLVNKISPLFVDEDGDYRSGLQKAKFALSDFIVGPGADLRTGAEWYNKLDADTQKEIIEEKIKFRKRGELGGVPLYDEEFAGKFGIGGNYANGGRIGFSNGTEKPRAYEALMDKEGLDREAEERVKKINELAERISKEKGISFSDALEQAISIITPNTFSNDGKTNMDGSSKINKAKGGLMGIPVRKNSEGTTELDYRKSGGFVPIGVKEKADDVPAMLSKNEFVMTADAVRAAGGGSIEKGAQKMYDTMKKLESRVA